ncbi:MAG: choice-of-anchor Q domain-containing protein [Isosphaeraceae bacterium]|nr:choice-of-anchor Q domain-containing protein [Isosphaeraceae bacterium]
MNRTPARRPRAARASTLLGHRRSFQPALFALEERTLLSTFTVSNTLDDGSAGSLRWAIGQANSATGADTIDFDAAVFATPQTITLTGGELAVTDDLSISGPGADRLTVDADQTSRVFRTNSNVRMEGLTVTGGLTEYQGQGGGIHNTGALTLVHSTVTANRASYGGGGIYNSGALTLIDSMISENSVGVVPGAIPGPFPTGGGGILNDGELTATRTIISGNHDFDQGGGLFNFGRATLNASTISQNYTESGVSGSDGGGGVWNFGQLAILDSTLSDNRADFGYGGGVYTSRFGTTTITDSTLSGNKATYDGGGLYNLGNLTLIGSSVVRSFYASQGGLVNSGGNVSLANTILAGNGGADYKGSAPTLSGVNLVQDGSVTGPSVINADPLLGPLQDNGGPTLTHALLPGSPARDAGNNLFVTDDRLTDQRGPGFPRIRGAAVDLGAVEGEIEAQPVTVDAVVPVAGESGVPAPALVFAIRRTGEPVEALDVEAAFAGTADASDYVVGVAGGVATPSGFRFAPGSNEMTVTLTIVEEREAESPETVFLTIGPGADFSADTAIGLIVPDADMTVTVTTTADDGAGSLRAALRTADAIPGPQVVVFHPTVFSVPQTITLTTGELAIRGGVDVVGPGAKLLTVNGNGRGRVFNVDDGSNGTTQVVRIDGLTVAGGSTAGNGGGIFNAENLTLVRSTVTGNTSGGRNQGGGGGLYNRGILEMTDSTVSGNTANGYYGYGGGLNNRGTLTITSSTVSGNTANGYSSIGGGLFNRGSVTITGSTVARNGGSGVQNSGGGQVTLANSILAGNNGDYRGGTPNLPGANLVADGSLTGANVINVDPLLGPLTDNGGPTLTHALLPGSPAIDAADPAFATATDQRGVARPQGLGFDIGAFELESDLTVTSIAVYTDDATVAGGLTAQFTATATLSDGSTLDVTRFATWASTDPAIATISGAGLASALAQGTTVITASIQGVTSSGVTLNVTPAELVSISVSPGNPAIDQGTTQQFTATGSYTDGSTADLTGMVAWASATPSVATIDAFGLATGVGVGSSVITASLGGVESDDALLTVLPLLQSIMVSPGDLSLAKGSTQQLTATGGYSDGSTADLTSLVIWASSTTSTATIDGAGLAATLAEGSTIITASLGGLTSPGTTLTVTPAELVSISVSPDNPSIEQGETQQFTAIGSYTDGSTADLTGMVAWASATPSVATIDAFGLATGVGFGSSVITASLGGVTSDGVTLAVLKPASPLVVSTTNDAVDASDGLTSLREAIAFANANGGPDTITFDPAVFSTARTILLNGTQLELTDSATTTIEGPGAALLSISGNNASRVLRVDSLAVATISGVTVTGGNSDSGGGVFNEGVLTLYGTNVTANTASGNGGGLRNAGMLRVTGSTISGNSAGQGAGLQNDGSGSATFIDCEITGNSSLGSFGGGGAYNAGSISLTRCTISGNTTTFSAAGGLYLAYGEATLTDCTISSNRGGFAGGGIHVYDSVVVIVDSTIAGNEADTGGGVSFNVGSLTLRNVTVSENRARSAEGVGGVLLNNEAAFINTLMAGNTSGSVASDVGGSGSAIGSNNLIGTGGSGGLIDGVDGNIVGVADPMLAPLGFYGGPTQTMPLLPGSPAIDAALEALASEFDQRGLGRFGAPDSGAFESQGFTSASVGWGTVGSATLDTDDDGIRLLPEGRSLTLPWAGLHTITITLDGVVGLSADDFHVTGINVADYGPVTVTAVDSTYVISLARPIDAADRVTITVGDPATAAFTRRLDVLPGDVNDDGITNGVDMVAVRNAFTGLGPVLIPLEFLDLDGDGFVDIDDYNLVRRHLGKKLPKLPN